LRNTTPKIKGRRESRAIGALGRVPEEKAAQTEGGIATKKRITPPKKKEAIGKGGKRKGQLGYHQSGTTKGAPLQTRHIS